MTCAPDVGARQTTGLGWPTVTTDQLAPRHQPDQPATTDGLMARLEDEMRAFRPLTSKSPHQLVAQQFRQHMSLGWWPAGQPLPPERELASELNVSRETVRQAFKLLADEGKVTPGGPRVAAAAAAPLADLEKRRTHVHLRRQEFLDLHALRELIEIHAARRAAVERGREHLALMTKAQGNLRTAIETDSSDRFRAADTDFHLAVAAASGNVALRDEVRRIRSEMFLALDDITASPRRPDSAEQHQGILEAIRAGDEGEATQRMEQHLHQTGQRLKSLFD